MKGRYYLFIIFIEVFSICMLPSQVNAQKAHGIQVFSGAVSTHLRDKSMSPLLYSGLGFNVGGGYRQFSEKKTMYFRMNFQKADLSSNPGNDCNYLGFSFKNHTFYRRNNSEEENMRYGWSNNNILASYTNDAYGNYGSRSYYFTSFGPAASFLQNFSLFEREFRFDIITDVQLLGFYLRPSYISGNPEGYLDASNSNVTAFLKSIEPFYPGRAFNAGIHTTLSYKLSTGNEISIGYNYQYSFVNRPEPVTSSIGNWVLSIITKL